MPRRIASAGCLSWYSKVRLVLSTTGTEARQPFGLPRRLALLRAYQRPGRTGARTQIEVVTGSRDARDTGRAFCFSAMFPAGPGAARGRMGCYLAWVTNPW